MSLGLGPGLRGFFDLVQDIEFIGGGFKRESVSFLSRGKFGSRRLEQDWKDDGLRRGIVQLRCDATDLGATSLLL